ncbi:MAG: PLDc N-terminal domain-containing protein [Chitinophagales bacterium]|nr:PLDc N-terminal domain-containing protein [Chitinophagales bacterium]
MMLHISFSGMDSFVLLLFFLSILIWLIALVAIANGRFTDNTTKICWFFIVLTLNIAGVLLFIGWGRKEVAGINLKSS